MILISNLTSQVACCTKPTKRTTTERIIKYYGYCVLCICVFVFVCFVCFVYVG